MTDPSAILCSMLLFSVVTQTEQPVPTSDLQLLALGSLVLLTFAVSLVRLYVGLGVLVLAMLLSPEVVVQWGGQRPIQLRLEDFLMMALVLAWVTNNIAARETTIVVRTPLNPPLATYFAVLCISTIYGFWLFPVRVTDELATSLLYLAKVTQFLMLFYLTVSTVGHRRRVVLLVAVSFCTAWIVVLYGLYQAFVLQLTRVSTPMEGASPEPNTLGGYLTLVLALALCLLLYLPPRHGWVRFNLLALIACGALCLMFTLSRASFIGFLCMLVCLAFIFFSNRHWGYGLGVLIGLGLFCLLFPFIAPTAVIDRINLTFQSTAPDPYIVEILGFRFPLDSSTAERIGVWETKVWWTFLHGPMLIGYGINYLQILDSHWARLVVETGILGVWAFCWIVVRTIRMAWYVHTRSEDWLYRAFALGYLVAFVGLLVHSMGTITFYIVRIMEPFWFFTGVLAFAYRQTRSQEVAHVQERTTETAEQEALAPDAKPAFTAGFAGQSNRYFR